MTVYIRIINILVFVIFSSEARNESCEDHVKKISNKDNYRDDSEPNDAESEEFLAENQPVQLKCRWIVCV